MLCDAAILIDYFMFHYIPQYMERCMQRLTQYKQQDMIVMHDITKERELQEKYRYLATHDALTGLYNRTFFFEKAEEFMKRNPDEKLINYLFGHQTV